MSKYIIPNIGFGTYTLKDAEAIDGVLDALKIGYRHIDTADMYHNHSAVGEAINQSGVPRSEVFLTTKVWHTDLKRDALKSASARFLEELQQDYIDLLLIHWPSSDGTPLEETLGALQEVKESGITKNIGVSNFPPKMLEQALLIAPDLICDQVESHLLLAQCKLMDVINAANIQLVAYSPLALGKVVELPAVQEMAKKYETSPAAIALYWLIQDERKVVIPRAKSHQHRQENWETGKLDMLVSDIQTLSQGLRDELRIVNPVFAPDWEG